MVELSGLRNGTLGSIAAQELNGVLTLVEAAGDKFHYVPLYENTTLVCGDNKHQYSIGDGVHPNAFGHLHVAGVFARTIASTLCPNHRTDQTC